MAQDQIYDEDVRQVRQRISQRLPQYLPISREFVLYELRYCASIKSAISSYNLCARFLHQFSSMSVLFTITLVIYLLRNLANGFLLHQR